MAWFKKQMKVHLSFLGAARNVTGSRHLIEVDGTKVLVDCGLYQERQFKDRNWDPFPVNPAEIDALLLTHAHLDHCGLIPKLVKEGFKGKIYCTDATAEIAKIILLDSAHIQEEDAAYKKKRHEKQGKTSPHAYEPLYTTEDVEACFPLFAPLDYKSCVKISDSIEVCLYDAGHVLGSAIIKVTASEDHQKRIMLFTGDIGRPDRPIVCDPDSFEQADYVIIESTYGDRVHQPTADIKDTFAEIINKTYERGGKIIIPSFALERSQEVLYYLNELLREERIPQMKVFLDSPMATRITKVFKKHPEMFDSQMRELVMNHESPFILPGLQFTESTNESKAINEIKGPMIIIAGSGMCTGGRIKHHIANNINDPNSTIVFVGYQAVGTLGRRFVNGEKEIRILGEERRVQAEVARIHGFSAHADKVELLNWLKELKSPPRRVFVVHGEENAAIAFGDYLKEETSWDVLVPEYNEKVVLD